MTSFSSRKRLLGEWRDLVAPCALLLCLHLQILLILKGSGVEAVPILKQAHFLHRHGDRTSLGATLRCANVTWPEGDGQLTAIGCQQLTKLGQTLRARFCPSLVQCNYSPHDIYVMASHYDRTIASANCAMAGFYNLSSMTNDVAYNDSGIYTPIGTPTTSTMVPVYIYDDTSDQYSSNFYLRGYDNCRPYYYPWPSSAAAETPLYTRSITKNPEFIANAANFTSLIANWTNVTCVEGTNYNLLHVFVDKIFDPLHVQAEHHVLGPVTSFFDTATLDSTYNVASFMEGTCSNLHTHTYIYIQTRIHTANKPTLTFPHFHTHTCSLRVCQAGTSKARKSVVWCRLHTLV